mgnify:CR=1 FL=1
MAGAKPEAAEDRAAVEVDADGDGATVGDYVDQCDIRYIGRPLLCDQEGTFLTSVFGYSFNWDARNDRIDPTNGFDLSLSQDAAGLGGEELVVLDHRSGRVGLHLLKITGSAFTIAATVPEAALAFTRGTPKRVEWKADSGNLRFGLFCGECGSRIANGQTPTNGVLSLRAGTLDDTTWVEPVGDIWTKSAQRWVRFIGDLSTEGQPKDYTPFMERYRAQGRF